MQGVTSSRPLTIMNGFRAESTPMTTTLPDHVSGPNSLGARLDDHRRQNPGQPLLIRQNGLAVTAAFEASINELLERVQGDGRAPVVLTSLSNAVIDLNPFSGLQPIGGSDTETATLEAMVALLGTGELMEWDTWPEHFALFSAAAVEALARQDTSTANVMNRLREAGGMLLLSDCVFLHDPGAGLFDEKPLEPHERRRPIAWGLLRQRLDQWLRLGRQFRLTRVEKHPR